MDSPMFKAFMENQKFSDKQADDIEIAKQQIAQDIMMEASKQLGRSQKISDYTLIAGELTENDINQKTESHPNLENYDHSLEKVRTLDNMIAPEPEPEGLRLLGRGLPAIENGEDPNDMPDFSIDWGSLGDTLVNFKR